MSPLRLLLPSAVALILSLALPCLALPCLALPCLCSCFCCGYCLALAWRR
ncbi:hypothetical protein [Lysobacter gummosus]